MEQNSQCSEEDMIDFWARDWQKNRLTHHEEGRTYAKRMFKCFVKAGLGFQDILNDYLSHPGFCPENKKTGKTWLELLNEHKKSKFPPHCLIISAIKYFKSKGPQLCLGNVLDEERDRLRISDHRVVFLRFPQEERDKIRNVNAFLTKVFRDALFVDSTMNINLIKIGFRNYWDKKRSLEYARKRHLIWPNTQSKFQFEDPDKRSMGHSAMGTSRLLQQVGIANELLFLNFRCMTSQMKFIKELRENFPGLVDWKNNVEKSQLTLYFKEDKDAFNGFQKTKNFTLCDCKCTVIFNRRRGTPNQIGNLRNDTPIGQRSSPRKREYSHPIDQEFRPRKKLRRDFSPSPHHSKSESSHDYGKKRHERTSASTDKK